MDIEMSSSLTGGFFLSLFLSNFPSSHGLLTSCEGSQSSRANGWIYASWRSASLSLFFYLPLLFQLGQVSRYIYIYFFFSKVNWRHSQDHCDDWLRNYIPATALVVVCMPVLPHLSHEPSLSYEHGCRRSQTTREPDRWIRIQFISVLLAERKRCLSSGLLVIALINLLSWQ